jgi:hypothetical protein
VEQPSVPETALSKQNLFGGADEKRALWLHAKGTVTDDYEY